MKRKLIPCTGLLLLFGLLSALSARQPRNGPTGVCAESKAAVVEPVSDKSRECFGLSDFYRKQVSWRGFLVLGSEKVSDYALLEAHYIISSMLAGREDILEGLVSGKVRCAVMAPGEFTTDIPEHSDLKPAKYWNRRARGLGPTRIRPCVSCGEENLLQYRGDPYPTENILVHEFGHAIHKSLKRVDPEFDGRLKGLYEEAREKGLWEDKYAGGNRDEYWAEGVQSYFGTNRENDHDHNHVNTRDELREYDPGLAELLDDVFQENPWQYVPPRDRKDKAHLTGYDPERAPSFHWPEGQDASRRPGPVIRDIEGWKVRVDPRLLKEPGREVGDNALFALRAQLHRIVLLADAERLEKLRQLEIWIELDHPDLKPMQYHPSVDWLRNNRHDERLEKKVHIPHARSLLSRRESAKHPWVVLHELAHAYQDRFVGWNNKELKAAYEKAKEEGQYEEVLHIFGGKTRHYALTDHHEYFAEGTESYFGRNDFYPFVRAELKEHDPTLYEFLRKTWGDLP